MRLGNVFSMAINAPSSAIQTMFNIHRRAIRQEAASASAYAMICKQVSRGHKPDFVRAAERGAGAWQVAVRLHEPVPAAAAGGDEKAQKAAAAAAMANARASTNCIAFGRKDAIGPA